MGINKKEVITKNDEYYEETTTELKRDKNTRGFGVITFSDLYEQECSLQDSSLATEAAIWIGVDNTGAHIHGPNGTPNEHVKARMHLSQSMVKQLLPYLTKFAETGEYIANMKLPVKKKKTTKKKSKK